MCGGDGAVRWVAVLSGRQRACYSPTAWTAPAHYDSPHGSMQHVLVCAVSCCVLVAPAAGQHTPPAGAAQPTVAPLHAVALLCPIPLPPSPSPLVPHDNWGGGFVDDGDRCALNTMRLASVASAGGLRCGPASMCFSCVSCIRS